MRTFFATFFVNVVLNVLSFHYIEFVIVRLFYALFMYCVQNGFTLFLHSYLCFNGFEHASLDAVDV